MNSRPELAELQEHVRTNKWLDLGLQLGLKHDDLEAIKLEYLGNTDDCRRVMFSKWLRATPEASRKQLIDALNSKAVDEVSKAREYQKYVDPQFSQETQPATLGM